MEMTNIAFGSSSNEPLPHTSSLKDLPFPLYRRANLALGECMSPTPLHPPLFRREAARTLGECISMKSLLLRNSRKREATPD